MAFVLQLHVSQKPKGIRPKQQVWGSAVYSADKRTFKQHPQKSNQ